MTAVQSNGGGVTGTASAASLPVEMFGARAASGARGPAMRQIAFTADGPAGPVPALLWLPAGDAANPRPAVLIGHGAGGHKAAPLVEHAAGLVTALGLAALSVDCPYHGDRTPPEEAGLTARQRRDRLGLHGWRERNAAAVPGGVADWRAALDAAQALREVAAGPAGYLGLSLGARYGVPLTAEEERITAAVLGLYGTPDAGPVADAARRVRVPVLFMLQWDDELYPRDGALTLFGLLGSADKTLHARPGGHMEFPPAELAEGARFLAGHLMPAVPT